jgi:hypothetical protein
MGYVLSHSRKQRIHIESSMFSSALVDFTVVITDSMVPELAEAGGLLDSAGPALSDGHDIRIAADANGDVALPIDLRGYTQDADPANGSIEFATKLSLTDPIAGNDIYIFFGDDDAATLAPGDPLGQYNAYDDNYFLISPCGCGLDRSRNQWATTNNGGLTPGDAVTPWGLGTIFDGNASQQYLSFDDIAEWNALLEVDQPNSCEVLARNDNTASGLPQFIAAKIAETTSYQGWNFLYHAGINELTVNNNYGTGSAIGRAAAFTMVQGTWYHLATTYSGNNNASGFLIYANGVNLTTSDKTTGTGSTNQHSYPFLVGARGWGKPSSQREWDGVLDELRMSSVVRSADWIAATHSNFMNGDTLLTGYNYSPVLGEVIPYSGNEAAYESFNSVGGGYFQGDGNAQFDINEISFPYTTPFKLTFRHKNTYNGYDAIIGYKATNEHRIFTNNGVLIFAAVSIDIDSDADSLWHTYELIFDGSFFSATKDGSPIGSTVPASITTGNWVWEQLLAYRTAKSQNAFQFIEIEIDGVVEHYFDFGLANAAGDAGPDRVWDLVGGIHGAGINTADSNWGRTANLPNNLRNGFNLYSLEPNFPVPASLNSPGFDPFGVAIQYDNAVTGQSINGELFENASIFYDGSVNPGNVSISGQLHTNPQTFYNGLLTPGNVIISGQLFTNTSIFYNNIIDSGSTVIYGNVYTNTPTFYSGSIETGNVNISGGLHTNVSTFFDNEVRPSNYNISGNVYVNPQTFYSGSITGGEAVINGGLYTNSQTFYEGIISTSGVVVSGELFANSPVFFNNEFTLGTVVVNGELFTNVNVFYNNAIIQGLSILGELFINTNVFYPSLVFPESDHIDGELFENASIFYANEIALAPEDFIEIHIALSAKPFASIDFTARQGVRFEDVSSPQTVNGVLFINSQTFYIGEIEWL